MSRSHPLLKTKGSILMSESLSIANPAQNGAPRMAPSSLGEILDRTVQLYRTRFMLYLGISLVPSVLVVVP